MTRRKIILAMSLLIMLFAIWDLFFPHGYKVYLMTKDYGFPPNSQIVLNKENIGKVDSISTGLDSIVVITLRIKSFKKIPVDARVSYHEGILSDNVFEFNNKNSSKLHEYWNKNDTIKLDYLLIRSDKDTLVRVLQNGIHRAVRIIDSANKDRIK